MVFCDESLHKLLHHATLNISQALKILQVMPKRKQRLPASNGVGADAWVRSPQLWRLVEWPEEGSTSQILYLLSTGPVVGKDSTASVQCLWLEDDQLLV